MQPKPEQLPGNFILAEYTGLFDQLAQTGSDPFIFPPILREV
jgi:hypothetical protein